MAGARPSFAGPRQRPPGADLRVLGALLVITAGMFAAWQLRGPDPQPVPVMVEVDGNVANPGLHPVEPPATVHRALRAAGHPIDGVADGPLPEGARVVVGDDGVRVERMADPLVFGLPLDVNRAGVDALESLPGIGPSTAAAIVADREANGRFETVEALDRVRGVGPATVEKLAPFVEVVPAQAPPSPGQN